MIRARADFVNVKFANIFFSAFILQMTPAPSRHVAEMQDMQRYLERWAERERRIPIEPPCDSPIEDIFLWEFKKVAAENVQLRRQQYCKTPLGWKRLDFVLSRVEGSTTIAVECDGRDFHSGAKDSERDAAIVSTGIVEKVYPLRGRDINFHIHDTLHLLGQREPWLISDRGQIHLDRLSEPEARREDVWGVMSSPGFPYGIMRSYIEPRRASHDGDEPDEPDEPDEEYFPKLPTLICWTQRKR
jgi:very-short-patch-repair endonuclease